MRIPSYLNDHVFDDRVHLRRRWKKRREEGDLVAPMTSRARDTIERVPCHRYLQLTGVVRRDMFQLPYTRIQTLPAILSDHSVQCGLLVLQHCEDVQYGQNMIVRQAKYRRRGTVWEGLDRAARLAGNRRETDRLLYH